MKRMLYALLALLVIIAWRDWGRREITHQPGILVPQHPLQGEARRPEPIALGAYRLTPRASYEIRARVLAREDYRWGEEAGISPVDLALGWGPMSDQAVLDRIEIRQGSRWYFTRYDYPAPLPDREIIRNSSNVHIVPGTDGVRSRLKSIRRGDIVRARGYLVDVDHESGFRWRTSLSREDTGDGSCELFYIEWIDIEPR